MDQPRRAPPGFTEEQWEEFEREGFFVVPGALAADEVARYVEAIERVAAADPKHAAGTTFSVQRLAPRDPAFEELIDRDSHIGFAYDLYGELTKLHLSQALLRPRGGWRNPWHPDGPRALPYRAFTEVPLQLKIGYWLTDLPLPRMGNLVVLPGSHRLPYLDAYDTGDSIAGERIVTARAGDLLVMNANLWHRVEPNDTDVVRKNIFLTYSPSWIVSEDRYQDDPEFLARLTRERRILMRSYAHPYDNQKPPAADFPLFLERDSGLDRDPGRYGDHVQLHRRRRLTWRERREGAPACAVP